MTHRTPLAPPDPKVIETTRAAGRRALVEAEERRQALATTPMETLELGGRVGLEPTRFGDWERRGVAVDF